MALAQQVERRHLPLGERVERASALNMLGGRPSIAPGTAWQCNLVPKNSASAPASSGQLAWTEKQAPSEYGTIVPARKGAARAASAASASTCCNISIGGGGRIHPSRLLFTATAFARIDVIGSCVSGAIAGRSSTPAVAIRIQPP